eukprot:TRINITY_DN61565_c0_g1_i1.p1 TRINITY_DN61565_c0_g1~~TRINITY_DN61565_c0_g1_i1.p1  ORF type:complete len:267 (+),score=36.06 TRINITY_DN61565_c0_g1_i1:97-897(+)
MTDEAAVLVSDISGALLAEIKPIPANVHELKVALALKAEVGIPCSLQQFLNGDRILGDDEPLAKDEPLELTFCVDERPLFSWDIHGNPHRDQIEGEGGHLLAPNLRRDFVNVVAQEPVTSGTHFFEFVVHKVQDEQWCGMVHDKSQAGGDVYGHRLQGRFYYFRAGGTAHLMLDSGVRDCSVHRPKDGDIIGMIVDVETGVVAFSLNGTVQGSLTVKKPGQPLYFFTTVDQPNDHMELRKPPLSDAPDDFMKTVQGLVKTLQGLVH